MAVTRTSMHTGDSMNQNECLSVEQAIELMSEKGYEQMFMNDRFGKIAKGFTADFCVIDQDIRTLKPEEITETIKELDAVSRMFNIEFTISLSLDKEELDSSLEDMILVAL
jgi:predicted amidohydrolase YtcJ